MKLCIVATGYMGLATERRFAEVAATSFCVDNNRCNAENAQGAYRVIVNVDPFLRVTHRVNTNILAAQDGCGCYAFRAPVGEFNAVPMSVSLQPAVHRRKIQLC
jgi:hypothetical protein